MNQPLLSHALHYFRFLGQGITLFHSRTSMTFTQPFSALPTTRKCLSVFNTHLEWQTANKCIATYNAILTKVRESFLNIKLLKNFLQFIDSFSFSNTTESLAGHKILPQEVRSQNQRNSKSQTKARHKSLLQNQLCLS